MEELMQIISNMGFPIAACVALFIMLQKVTVSHKEEMDKMSEALDRMNAGIQAVSDAVATLRDSIQEIQKRIEDIER